MNRKHFSSFASCVSSEVPAAQVTRTAADCGGGYGGGYPPSNPPPLSTAVTETQPGSALPVRPAGARDCHPTRTGYQYGSTRAPSLHSSRPVTGYKHGSGVVPFLTRDCHPGPARPARTGTHK
jgi:hypothetical protein